MTDLILSSRCAFFDCENCIPSWKAPYLTPITNPVYPPSRSYFGNFIFCKLVFSWIFWHFAEAQGQNAPGSLVCLWAKICKEQKDNILARTFRVVWCKNAKLIVINYTVIYLNFTTYCQGCLGHEVASYEKVHKSQTPLFRCPGLTPWASGSESPQKITSDEFGHSWKFGSDHLPPSKIQHFFMGTHRQMDTETQRRTFPNTPVPLGNFFVKTVQNFHHFTTCSFAPLACLLYFV